MWLGRICKTITNSIHLCVCLVAQSYLVLCDPVDYSPPGYSVCGIFQAKTLEWLPLPPPGDLPNPGIEPESPAAPALAGSFFITEPSGKPSVHLLG